MRSISRRHLLAIGGVAAAGVIFSPGASLAGLFGNLLGQPEPRRTQPITPNNEFYVTSYRSPPTIHLNDWSLSIGGLVQRSLTLTYEQLLVKPTVSQIVTLECVGNTVAGEFISTARWEGVPLRSFLEEAGVRSDAYDVVFLAADGYSDSIRLDRAMAGDVMIAHRMNGVPLPAGHGFPARAIVPGHYGMKSVQWLSGIEVVAQDYKGYYAQKGWTDEAVIKTTSRIDLPGHGATVRGLHHTIEGVAFAGTRGIRLVEISTDGGASWTAAVLEPPLSPFAWVVWRYDWPAPKPGSYSLVIRATDGAGVRQTSIEQDPAPDGATGLHEIAVTVEA